LTFTKVKNPEQQLPFGIFLFGNHGYRKQVLASHFFTVFGRGQPFGIGFEDLPALFSGAKTGIVYDTDIGGCAVFFNDKRQDNLVYQSWNLGRFEMFGKSAVKSIYATWKIGLGVNVF